MTSRIKTQPGLLRNAPPRLPMLSVEGPPFALGLVALESIQPGVTILHVEGVARDTPSKYSVQIGENVHLDPPPGGDATDNPEKYLWRYLNHSCRPNAAFQGARLVAIRAIHPGEQVLFNYNTTELEISNPFQCHCGACDNSLIRGYVHLTPAQQAELEPHVAPHLRRHRATSAVAE